LDKRSVWMAISGVTGLSFALIANCTELFVGSQVLAGVLQLGVNAFVFVNWRRAFLERSGWKKAFAFCGVVVPVLMASITLVRVLLPALVSAFI
jgi:hypothetical protein